ncbi:MAG: transposase [Coprococcus sp.]
MKEVSKWTKNSLAHTTWKCKDHIVFAPKYRRKIIYQQIRADIGRIYTKSITDSKVNK